MKELTTKQKDMVDLLRQLRHFRPENRHQKLILNNLVDKGICEKNLGIYMLTHKGDKIAAQIRTQLRGQRNV